MANFNQLSQKPFFELPMKNLGGTTIPANRGVLIDSAADMAAKLPTASGGVTTTLGVTVADIAAGAVGRVAVSGTMVMTADGALTAGDEVQISDTVAKLGFAKLKGAGVDGLGQCLVGGADGDPVLVLINHANNA